MINLTAQRYCMLVSFGEIAVKYKWSTKVDLKVLLSKKPMWSFLLTLLKGRQMII